MKQGRSRFQVDCSHGIEARIPHKLVFLGESMPALDSAISKLSRHRVLLHFITLLAMGTAIAGVAVSPKVRVPLSPDKIESVGGAGYRIAIAPETWPGFVVQSETSGKRQPKIKLLENGDNIGTASSSLEEVQHEGGDRFTYSDGYLYFSTRDGSDPRVNGHVYAA